MKDHQQAKILFHFLRKLMKPLLITIFFASMSPHVSLSAEENEKASSVLDNIGFIKNPPNELKKRFPMCDAFLNIEWIDRQKRIGYIQHEMISNSTGLRKMFWNLVWLNDQHPIASIDVYRYKKEGKLNELFDFIRQGTIVNETSIHLGDLYTIKDRGRTEDFSVFMGYGGGGEEYSWSNFQQTVCVPYPDGTKAWIIEGRKMKNLNENEQKKYYQIVSKAKGNITLRDNWFSGLWLLDINHDGRMDFINGRSVTYSLCKEYFPTRKIFSREGKGLFGGIAFLGSGKECIFTKEYTIEAYLATDGKNYYLGQDCNLSELTSSK